MTRESSVENDGVDVFLVPQFSSSLALALGVAPRDGPCDKDARQMSGVVMAIGDVLPFELNVLAHELGHYFGLRHASDEDNLMFDRASSGGLLTEPQGRTMRDHCFVQPGC